MKKILPMLLLTVTASVFAQTDEYRSTLDSMNAVLSARSAPKWRQNYRLTEDSAPSAALGITGDKRMQIINVEIWRRTKDIKLLELQMDELLKELAAVCEKAGHPVSLNMTFSERTFGYADTPTTYHVTPTYITTYCAGSFCSSTIRGGRVIADRGRVVPVGSRVLTERHWQNY